MSRQQNTTSPAGAVLAEMAGELRLTFIRGTVNRMRFKVTGVAYESVAPLRATKSRSARRP